ncbi:MAG: type II toxin-antitoxin system VapC family toxin [Gammaproteobacteria bacterium]|nr:type II toxin-antitoxin system VapC family toxin [Gammaproteobacteria bacterium]
MALPVVVPDASVLLKWVLPSHDEPEADRALSLRDAIAEETVQALLPGLWLYEVGNTLARRFPEHAEASLRALVKFQIEEAQPTARWLETVLALTRDYGVTFYDASYHAVAIVHGGVFITADRRYVGHVGGEGSINLLEEWSPPSAAVG